MSVSTARLLGVHTRMQNPTCSTDASSSNASLHHELKYTVGSDDASRPSVSMCLRDKSILLSDLHESATRHLFLGLTRRDLS